MSSDQIEQLARDYMGAFRDRDEAWFERFIAPEYVRHDPGLSFEVRGIAGVRKLVGVLHDAFSELELPICDAVVGGEKVLLRIRMRGVHTGRLENVPASGKRIDVDAMDLIKVADGKIVEQWALMDKPGMLNQIGAPG